MKRYIKSSFGLEDKDWMYPEDEPNQDFSCVDFIVRGMVATDEKGTSHPSPWTTFSMTIT